MRAGGAIVAGAATLFMVAACGFSLDGYSSSGASTSDGGLSSSGDGGPRTPGSEAGTSTSDSGSLTDANANLCAQPNLFCETFDQNGLSNTVAPTIDVTNGAVLEAVNGSLHSATPALAAGGTADAYFVHSLSNTGLHNALDVDLFVKSPMWDSSDSNVCIISLAMDGGGHLDEELYIANGRASMTTTYQSTQYLFDLTSKSLPYDRWVHVRIDVDFSPTNGAYIVSFDGEQVGQRQGISFGALARTAQLNPRLGISAPNSPIPAIDVLTDNVIVTAVQ